MAALIASLVRVCHLTSLPSPTSERTSESTKLFTVEFDKVINKYNMYMYTCIQGVALCYQVTKPSFPCMTLEAICTGVFWVWEWGYPPLLFARGEILVTVYL